MRIIPRAIYYISPFTTLKSIIKVLINRDLYRGKKVANFETQFSSYHQQSFGFTTSYARVSLFYILKSLDLPKNSEVLMTPINLPDMANACIMNDLKPVFCDYESLSIEPNYTSAKSLIGNKTRVFLYTHLYGIVPNMEKLKKFCDENNLILIQDCTQSVGAKYLNQSITDFSDYNYFSLCDLKVIHTHRGSIITSNKSDKIGKIKKIANTYEGKFNKRLFLKALKEDLIFSTLLNRLIYQLVMAPLISMLYLIKKDDLLIKVSRGEGITLSDRLLFKNLFNDLDSFKLRPIPNEYFYPFTELQAKIGLNSLTELPSLENRRISNSLFFLENIKIDSPFLKTIKYDLKNQNVFWKLPLIYSGNINFKEHLFSHNIDLAPINLPVISELEDFKSQDCPNANYLRKYGLCIPLHHYISRKEIEIIANVVNNYINE